MIDIFFNCLVFPELPLILIISLLFYLFTKKSGQDKLNKLEEEITSSIPRRSEECPQQYPNAWLPVYDSHELKKGEVKNVFALGRELVLYRGVSGKAYVFDAYCPHLGANLGVGGTVVGDDIKCKFHGWQFNDQGDCSAIPGLEDKTIPKTRIKKWRSDEVNDFIHVWHHLEGKDPDWFIPKHDNIERFTYCSKNVSIIHCHIQDIVENEADSVHFDTVHGSFSTLPKWLQKLIQIKTEGVWRVSDPPNTFCSETVIKVCLKFGFLKLQPIIFNVKQIGPATNISEMKFMNINILLTFNIITSGHLKQIFYIKWYSEPSFLGFILGKIMPNFTTVFAGPDMVIWNRKRFVKSPPFTKLDRSIMQFRRWYKQFYSDHSKIN